MGSTNGALVAWSDVCKPKTESMVGIRLMDDFKWGFRLKQVWNIFKNARSLWISWLNKYTLGRKDFWHTGDANRFSRTVRSTLDPKQNLQDLLRCVIVDRAKTSFWFSYWTYLGPLIFLFGDLSPRQLEILINASS